MLSKSLDVYKLCKLHKVVLGRKFTFEAGDLEFTFHPSKICNQKVAHQCVCSPVFSTNLGLLHLPLAKTPHLFQLEFFHTSEEQLRLLMAVAWEPQSNAGLHRWRWQINPIAKTMSLPYKSPFTTHKLQQQQPSSPKNFDGFVALSSPHNTQPEAKFLEASEAWRGSMWSRNCPSRTADPVESRPSSIGST